MSEAATDSIWRGLTSMRSTSSRGLVAGAPKEPSKSRVQKYYIGGLYDAVWNHENGNIYKVLIPVWFGPSALVTAATARKLCRGFVPGWLLFDD